MSPDTAVPRFFTKTLDFSGRASRSDFWWVVLIVDVLPVAAMWALGMPGYAYQIWLWALLLPRVSLSIRRLHDIGLSSAIALPCFVIISVLTVFNFLFLGGLVFVAIAAAQRGQTTENQWGPPPNNGLGPKKNKSRHGPLPRRDPLFHD
ncbi:DUF805 domain-containing protein [uncultured Pelagimonas sp.]|uniref:DUF805 domain-containing protein n=1 Tax=uncultured Pelagimonas sp. TaxID=1618102 RepID=UPI002606C5AC|nr:DUF805 domain-containing protein [uncultured Pelagimonas sp.]